MFITTFYHTQWTAFLVPCVTFVCVYEISRESLNGFAPNSQEYVFGPSLGRVWRSRSKVKDQRSRSPGAKRHLSDLSAACVRFMYGKTSLASSYSSFYWATHMLARCTLALCLCTCPSVCPSQVDVLSKWLKMSSRKQHRTIAHGTLMEIFQWTNIPNGATNSRGVRKFATFDK